MKVINSGRRYEIHEDDLKTFDSLPVGTYNLEFSKMSGFFLSQAKNLSPREEKIYGDNERKLDKVLTAFTNANRNLGVMFTGSKGQGKSLSIQFLSLKAITEYNTPVILCNENYKGMSEFIKSIDQRALFIFDEFEKTFPIDDSTDETQEDMLGLFDGMTNNQHLYLVTANNVNQISEYIINRPGRFHYHFKFTHPNQEEIREYMLDKLNPEYQSHIEPIVSLSYRMDFNYDSLRAIAFELNHGYSLLETISDLNIDFDGHTTYDVHVTYANGQKYIDENNCINFRTQEMTINSKCPDWHYIHFSLAGSSQKKGAICIDTSSIQVTEDSSADVDFDIESLAVKSIHLISQKHGNKAMGTFVKDALQSSFA